MSHQPAAAAQSGLRVHHPQTAEESVAMLRECWAGPLTDVFAFDLAVVPGPGFQRWLSQQLALGGDAPGICAGVDFCSLPALRHRLAGDDPWQPDRLVWVLQRLVGRGDDPALEVLRRHVAASREPYSACLRIARHFAGYATHRPGMLAGWARGEDLGPTLEPLADNAWQARLWRAAAGELGSTPLDRHEALLVALRQAPAPAVPHRVAVVAPTSLDAPTLALLEALATHHRVDLLPVVPTPGRWPAVGGQTLRADFRRPIGHPLNESLAAAADEQALLLPPPPLPDRLVDTPDTLLGRLQADLRADHASAGRPHDPADRSLEFHLCHGPDRQVEVLREVLSGLLADDPSLEPRDIVVITPDANAVAPLVSAAFLLPPAPGGHPGHGFRVQLADQSVAQTNPMVGLLLDLLALPDGRFEASTLLDLCAQPAVAARFGFTAERHERLVELVESSGVRWGLSAGQRRAFGLAEFPQNTWQAGVQRMLLGVALSETDLVTARTVLPLDDIDSSDVELAGAIAELVGRLSRLLAAFDSPAPIAEWARRCRLGLESLVALAPDQEWQLGDVWAGLARAADRGDQTPLGRHGALRVLGSEFRARPARGAFGNGSLVVSGPESLRQVPHRVVVLLGWDADRYPRVAGRHGDDLLGIAPRTGDPSASLTDRQLLLDAVLAARERLVVVARGRSEASNEPVPPAAPLQELRDAVDALAPASGGLPVTSRLTTDHPLQPFDPAYFDPGRPALRSVDPLAFRGALAALGPSARPERPRYRLHPLPPPDLAAGVALDDLTAFFVHPARQLLRRRAGLTLAEPRDLTDAMPIELDPLARWKLGDRILHRLRAGADPGLVGRAEWLRGEVPPAGLGRRALDGVFDDVSATLRRIPGSEAAPTGHDLALTVPVAGFGPVALSGRVVTTDGSLLSVQFSSVSAKHRLEGWLRLLALAAAEGAQPRAIVVGKSRAVALTAPPADEALQLLGRYLALYALGLSRPLPALPRVAERLARARRRSEEARHPEQIARFLHKDWDFDADDNWKAFFSFPAVLSLSATGVGLPGPDTGEPSLVGALAQLVWAPILDHEEG